MKSKLVKFLSILDAVILGWLLAYGVLTLIDVYQPNWALQGLALVCYSLTALLERQLRQDVKIMRRVADGYYEMYLSAAMDRARLNREVGR